jgi:hypothetical protein
VRHNDHAGVRFFAKSATAGSMSATASTWRSLIDTLCDATAFHPSRAADETEAGLEKIAISVTKTGDSGEVPAWMVQAFDQASRHRIERAHEDNRYGCRCLRECGRRGCRSREQHINRKRGQLAAEPPEGRYRAISLTNLKGKSASLDPAKVAQAVPQGRRKPAVVGHRYERADPKWRLVGADECADRKTGAANKSEANDISSVHDASSLSATPVLRHC